MNFKNMLFYYIDCIGEDQSEGVKLFLNDINRSYLIPPLDKEWGLSESSTLNLTLNSNQQRFIAQLLQRGNTGTLYYGYPVYVNWIERSASGWSGGFAIPIFLQTVEYDINGNYLSMQLNSHEWPRVNNYFLDLFFKNPESRKNFIHSVGLLENEGDPENNIFLDIINKLNGLGLLEDAQNTLNPSNFENNYNFDSIRKSCTLNIPIISIGERSRYTFGLEKELTSLKDRNQKIQNSSLKYFFNISKSVDTIENNNQDFPLFEVVPLNDEQRESIKSAFKENLTVITGPPGTGKSQVVTTILANAYLRGETVLFASRNHKAVDVVETRVNSLAGFPLLLRTGSKSSERNLRKEVIDFITRVLSFNSSEEDRTEHEEILKHYQDLYEELNNLWKFVEKIRTLRNKLDKLDREEKLIKEKVGADVIDKFKTAKKYPSDIKISEILDIVNYLLKSDLSIINKIKRWFYQKEYLKKCDQMLNDLYKYEDIFKDFPANKFEKNELIQWQEYLQEQLNICQAIELRIKYNKIYEKLLQEEAFEKLAFQIAEIEEKLWYYGKYYIASYVKLLPDRVTSEIRRALGEYRATIQRLATDQIRGKAYAKLRREQENLFDRISKILPVWCITNLSARGSLPLDNSLFDLVVVDEASQCDIPSAIPILYRAKRAVIIGDPNQLRHISSLSKLRDQQLQSKYDLNSAKYQPYMYSNNSLFDLSLTCSESLKVIDLREHFRSHIDIVNFSNSQWYNNKLRVCTDYRKLSYPKGIKSGIKWTDVQGTTIRPSRGSALNKKEAATVVKEVYDLLVNREFQGTVGIVSPFRAQVNRIRDLIEQKLNVSFIEKSELIVDTAHGFQGDERDVIIFSPCISREMSRGSRYFVSSTYNLFNVAITRARALLHIIGDNAACSVCGIPFIEKFCKYTNEIHTTGKHRSEFKSPKVGYWEPIFYEELKKIGLNPIPQYNFHQYILDFAILEENFRLNIEIDGELYHKEWDGSRSRRDIFRDIRLSAMGWAIKRFWVYQIKEEIKKCANEVKRLVDELKTKQGQNVSSE